jgi:protein-glucosylgalactosylhydroxylysine glucosidase
MDRRRFLYSIPGLVAASALGGCHPKAASASAGLRPGRSSTIIDRRALVARHDPIVRSVDPWATLSVGNGRFVFTADVTGLQTFPEEYSELPLATQSEWGWNSFPEVERFTLADASAEYDANGRPVSYASLQSSPAGRALRESPHRLSLARIGFDLRQRDGTPATPDDLTSIEQRLELWSGTLISRFQVDGRPVEVRTWSDPERDLLAVQVEAPTLDAEYLAIRFAFPYGSRVHTGDPADWSAPDRHRTELVRQDRWEVRWRRSLDDATSFTHAGWSVEAELLQEAAHRYRLRPAGGERLDLVVSFSPDEPTGSLPSVEEVRRASTEHWQRFWSTGGAVDLSGSADPRAAELERRVVLSQYLTAIQCSGTMPPQESGLTFNSWHGKFHLEMHWWHAVHFPLWDRPELLARSLPWYSEILPRARETARLQGYRGARWPKMVGPDGRESPSTIGVFLIWQQPHPIYYAELLYRSRPERAVLEAYREVVFDTAEFMASYPHWDEARRRYVLGPPLIPAQELHPARTTSNPTFELAYWEYGLRVAQRWRERLGQPRSPEWERVIEQLSPLPVRDGVYTNAETDLDTFHDADKRRDHPTLLGAYGFVPPQRVDRETMRRTLHRVMESWQWPETWGWDYPLIAMSAARLGEPEIAVDALLMDTTKNRYHPNGHNYQRPGLTVYLPGNGGLLTAIAMMARGWDGGPDTHAPGFPGSHWSVAYENLRPMP